MAQRLRIWSNTWDCRKCDIEALIFLCVIMPEDAILLSHLGSQSSMSSGLGSFSMNLLEVIL